MREMGEEVQENKIIQKLSPPVLGPAGFFMSSDAGCLTDMPADFQPGRRLSGRTLILFGMIGV